MRSPASLSTPPTCSRWARSSSSSFAAAGVHTASPSWKPGATSTWNFAAWAHSSSRSPRRIRVRTTSRCNSTACRIRSSQMPEPLSLSTSALPTTFLPPTDATTRGLWSISHLLTLAARIRTRPSQAGTYLFPRSSLSGRTEPSYSAKSTPTSASDPNLRTSSPLSPHCNRLSDEFPREYCLPFLLGEILDRVSQRGPRHALVVLLQKSKQRHPVLISYHAKHPAYRLVNQVVLVIEQHLCHSQCVLNVALPDQGHRGYHRDTPFPHTLRLRQSVEQLRRSHLQMAAYNFPAREIHQVPVVDVSRIAKIEVQNLSPDGVVPTFVLCDKNLQRGGAILMFLRLQQPLQLIQTQRLVTHNFAKHRSGDPEKYVSLAVLSYTGLEVARRSCRAFRRGRRLQLSLQRCYRHHLLLR